MLFSLRNNFLLLAGLVTLARAVDLGVPLAWREFSNSRPVSERITISQNAINEMLKQYTSNNGQFNGIGFWQAANAWSAIANHDWIAKTTTYQGTVTNALNTAFNLYANYDEYGYNDDAMWWATAAVYAHRAYGDSNLLAHAIATWNHVSSYVITQAQANAGSTPVKSYTIKATCDGHSMAGGVFWRPTTDDQGVNSITTGLYIALSAFLAEATGDGKYTTAAINSANWIKNVNMANNLVLDSVNPHDCTRSASSWVFTYNSGKFIEGLMVLGAVSGDSQWTDLAVNTIAAAVRTTAWQGSNGVITEGASPNSNNDGVGFKSVLIRGLHEAWVRQPNYTALRTLIHSYGDVQYNALLELAATGNTYSSAWAGPPQGFTSWGQLASLDVFAANIATN